jgi:PAS domain S-box-containing protein
MNESREQPPIVVLYVTTDGAHASAAERHLPDHAALDVVIESTVEDALDTVSEDGVDCIVSDHDLPDTDGVTFLETVRSQQPDLPFLLFTDGGSEDVASRAISANVTEYLIKDSFRDEWPRLAGLVEDAARFYRKRKSVIDTQHQAETVLRLSPDTIAVVQAGEFVYINDAGRDLFAVDDASNLYGTEIADHLLGGDGAEAIERAEAIENGARTLDRFDTRLADVEGTEHLVQATVTGIAWCGEPAVLWICRDVTERRETKQERDLLRQLIERISDSVFVIDDATGEIIDANEGAAESLGFDHEELLGKTVPDISTRFGDQTEYLQFIETTDGNRDSPIEGRHIRADGTTFPVEVSASTVEVAGTIYRLAIARDVTERQAMEQALRKSEERYRTLFESFRDAILVADTDRRIVDCNPAFENLFGYELGEIEGKHPKYLYENESEFERLRKHLDGRIEEPNLYATVNYQTKSGDVFPGETNVFYLRDDEGEIKGFIGLIRDVSDRLERERQLERYEQAVEQSSDQLVAIDDENTIVIANRRYREFHGLSRDDIGQVSLEEGLGAEMYAKIEPYLERSRAGELVEFEMERPGPDGERRTMDIRYYPVLNEDGTAELGVATLRDITERVEMESELQTYQEIVEHVEDPILLQDLEGRFQAVNEAVTEYAGLTKEELLGEDESAFVDPAAADRIEEMKTRVIEEERPIDYEVSTELPRKGTRTFSTMRYPHFDEVGEIDGTVAICRDVTDQRDREQQLTVLDRILRHNLNNEMNVMMGHAEQILAEPGADHVPSARQILQSGRDLVELAEKERRIVRLLENEPRIEPTDLEALLRRTVADISETYPESRITLDCADDLQVAGEGNLRVAVQELVKNAIDHHDRKHPTVEITAVEAGNDVRITVADDGPGIPPEEQLILTGHEEVQPLFHGSGLGLWLVNHVVRRSNGSLRFDENEPRGSVVEIRLSTP